MRKSLTACALLCTAPVFAGAQAQPETFVIHDSQGAQVPTVMIPISAVSTFSADAAEAIAGVDPRIEAMRLSGDVRIQVIGERRPIEITADRVVLELTADEKKAPPKSDAASLSAARPKGAEQHAESAIRSRSSESVQGGEDRQTFVGHVSFTVETIAGVMQIRAERVDHKMGVAAGV